VEQGFIGEEEEYGKGKNAAEIEKAAASQRPWTVAGKVFALCGEGKRSRHPRLLKKPKICASAGRNSH